MAIQWVLVCTQDVAPSVNSSNVAVGPTFDCSKGTVQVVPYQYLNADMQAFGSLLNLSNADSAAIGAAIVLVWSSAWAVKMVARSLGGSKNETD